MGIIKMQQILSSTPRNVHCSDDREELAHKVFLAILESYGSSRFNLTRTGHLGGDVFLPNRYPRMGDFIISFWESSKASEGNPSFGEVFYVGKLYEKGKPLVGYAFNFEAGSRFVEMVNGNIFPWYRYENLKSVFPHAPRPSSVRAFHDGGGYDLPRVVRYYGSEKERYSED
ncbi:MAG: hypothetical protein Q7S74_02175 [Nanoarchaeota archaeon]|nr:hypothetical protein [Nanoarchaeota archaeon]